MKILAIRGKNLASLEDEFEIDFTAEPLRSAGIFAITGSTGAGKSTLLDTMCLALFDDAPRTSKAGENIQVCDVKEKTINQKDSRSILRRGTGEGYAGVDFIALDGHSYRSLWTVRRARGKSDGALQSSEIRLTDLSAMTEAQGTKKELLQKITELIGLTFEQFTRAVLLAQGDFATFLKARQSEKAELLEKLTGTEVYSRISATIYRRAREAEQQLDILKQRMQDIKPLTEEELSGILENKATEERKLLPLKNIFLEVKKKLDWISLDNQYRKELLQAEAGLLEGTEKLALSAGRFEYMALWDIAGGIRNAYLEWQDRKRQLIASEEKLTAETTKQIAFEQRLAQQEKELLSSRELLEAHVHRYEQIRPHIIRARELDTRIQSVKENYELRKKEYIAQESLFRQTESNIQKLKDRIAEAGNKAAKLEKWFEDKSVYESLVSRVELLTGILEQAKSDKSQLALISGSLAANRELLGRYKKEEETLQQESEKLNTLLPAEVYHLREKLQEGIPCSVCGSIHHPFVGKEVSGEREVNERQLEEARKNNTSAINTIKEKIEEKEKEITRLDILHTNHETQYQAAIDKCTVYFSGISNWQQMLGDGSLLKYINDFVLLWNNNKEQQEILLKQKESLYATLESEKLHSTDIKEEYERRSALLQEYSGIQERLLDERKLLLGGKNTDEVEKKINTEKEALTSRYEQLRNDGDKIKAELAVIRGAISQLTESITLYKEQEKELNGKIEQWLQGETGKITYELLQELIGKPYEWVAEEKKYLHALKERESNLRTVVKEKAFRLEKHNASPEKPGEKETMEYLNNLLAETENEENRIKHILTEIEIALSNHKTAKEKMAAFEKEWERKNSYSENWKKLNVLFGSADGAKFKTIAQGYTLDILLGYANRHLTELTQRYKLEKIPDTLALQVIDNDMLGEVRSVHSLSGGESFLISLSLALGLSSLSSNRMKIESLFIDEGFGSLDAETLSIAMSALENLQTQGRKIGVISHVAEMTEKIATRIQVVKSSNGKSRIEITG